MRRRAMSAGRDVGRRTIVRTFDGPVVIVAVIAGRGRGLADDRDAEILDRQRYWAFFKAYVICYVSLVGLYIVIDAFSNLDEFTKRADTAVELFQIMGRYYLVHQSQFFDQLCGVIGMMAAIFTVTWMQRNNEQLAMLAAGISTQRAIRPVLVSSVIVSAARGRQPGGHHPPLRRGAGPTHDDDGAAGQLGVQPLRLAGHHDPRQAGRPGHADDHAVLRDDPGRIFGQIREIDGQQATYIPPDHPTAPLKGGWLIREATINPPLDDESFQDSGEILTRVNDTDGLPAAAGRHREQDRQGRTPSQPPTSRRSPAPSAPHAPFGDRLPGLGGPPALCLDLRALEGPRPAGSKDRPRPGHVLPEVEPDVSRR